MSAMLAARLYSATIPSHQSPSPQSSFRLRASPVVSSRSLEPWVAALATTVSTKSAAAVAPLFANRSVVHIGLPSKGRMVEQTLSLLKSCQLSVRQLNPRQYTVDIPLIPNLEVWFQRPKDIVRKLQLGDLDLGIVGFDTVSEYRHMGMADAIVDLVSSGTTLRENNLKKIEGGIVLESQATLVASRRSLHKRDLEITHELVERLEAHLRASAELMGPSISPVYCRCDGEVDVEYYAMNVVVPQKLLYKAIQQLRFIGGSRVLVTKLTYIFDEETPRWRNLLTELEL